MMGHKLNLFKFCSGLNYKTSAKNAKVTQNFSGLQTKILDPCCGSIAATKLILLQVFLALSEFSNVFMNSFELIMISRYQLFHHKSLRKKVKVMKLCQIVVLCLTLD